MSAEQTVTPVREAHKALTQERIVQAALEVIQRGEAETLTVAQVASEAGVTERTIYRHFPTRDDLMAAVWAKVNERVATPTLPATPAEVIAQPMEMFPAFDEQEALIRAIVFTKQGRELRLSVNAERQKRFRQAVAMARPDLKEPEFTRVCAAVQLLDSSFAWSVMKDYWGLSGEEAGRAASAAITVLLTAPSEQPKTKTEKSQ